MIINAIIYDDDGGDDGGARDEIKMESKVFSRLKLSPSWLFLSLSLSSSISLKLFNFGH